MRGHLKKRYKNSWTIVLDLGRDPLTGKRRQRWFSVKGTRSQAEKRLTELLSQHDLGVLPDPGKLTLGDFLTRWIQDYAANLSPRGLDRYSGIVQKHLVPELGNIPLSQLRPQHLQAHYTAKLRVLSPASVRYHHAVLHKALDTAVAWELISRNPADAATPPPKHQPVIQTWNESEMASFLTTARQSGYYALFHTALTTGARRSELLALRWRDVDFSSGCINICRSLHQTRDGLYHFSDTKSKNSRRTVTLPTSTMAVLQSHKTNNTAAMLLAGFSCSEDSLVFCHPDGNPLRPNTVTRAWYESVKKAGVKNIRFHDARHTHASLLLKAGIHPKVVQERLGHYSIQMTLDIYSHVMPGLQESAASSFDKILKDG